MSKKLSMPTKILDELDKRIEKIEQVLHQIDETIAFDSLATRRDTITFYAKQGWSIDDMACFCHAVGRLYDVFLVETETEEDEDCERQVRKQVKSGEWKEAAKIILDLRQSHDTYNYIDGRLFIKSLDLPSRGLTLTGWKEPIRRLRKLITEFSLRDTFKKRTKVVERRLRHWEIMDKEEREPLVVKVHDHLGELKKLHLML